MYWETYGGQDIAGFKDIGTDDYKMPIGPGFDLEAALAEIQRRCGRLCEIKLYREA